eukprot:scaffold2454_cov58-Attheya_sp.AAC.2
MDRQAQRGESELYTTRLLAQHEKAASNDRCSISHAAEGTHSFAFKVPGDAANGSRHGRG